jgi:hypothetical protein
MRVFKRVGNTIKETNVVKSTLPNIKPTMNIIVANKRIAALEAQLNSTTSAPLTQTNASPFDASKYDTEKSAKDASYALMRGNKISVMEWSNINADIRKHFGTDYSPSCDAIAKESQKN